MALSDARILRQNPWWEGGDWTVADPHLSRLREQPVVLPAPVVEELDLRAPGIHVLRGPRQVGKSTDLKLVVRRAIESGRPPAEIVYLPLDLVEDQPVEEVAATIERAKVLSGSRTCLLLLDEVTVPRGWSTAVKALWDDGTIDRDVVVCTGSSAIDLAGGSADRLPGRRGAGLDHLVLPQSFASFATAIDASIPRSPGLSVEGLLKPEGLDELRRTQRLAPQLDRAMELYLRFGGLPAAVAEAAGGASRPGARTKSVVWDSLFREVQRKRVSIPALEALLERVVRSLGSKTSWSHMAREMDVPLGSRARGRRRPDYRVLRDYVELLAAGYFTLIVYFWRRGADSNAVSNDKKLYLGDPLLHAIALDRAPGLAFDPAGAVENAIALSLYRRYEPPERQMESFVSPDRLHVWTTAKGREVDFVCGPRGAVDAVEVKYRTSVDRRGASSLARSFPHRPTVVATKSDFALEGDLALIPASRLLWALG